MDTYTYTARDADDPEKVMTFTLQEDYLEVNMTGFLDSVGEALSEKSRKEALKTKVKKQARPTMLKVMEEISGPINIGDVKGEIRGENDNQLKLTVWKRVGGLRAAPIRLDFGKVDNPQAAQAFIQQLNERKEEAGPIGNFFGPLDYWLGWFVLIFTVIILWKWPRRKRT